MDAANFIQNIMEKVTDWKSTDFSVWELALPNCWDVDVDPNPIADVDANAHYLINDAKIVRGID